MDDSIETLTARRMARRAVIRAARRASERERITLLLEQTLGNVSEAARQDGVDRVTMHKWIRQLGIRTADLRPKGRPGGLGARAVTALKLGAATIVSWQPRWTIR